MIRPFTQYWGGRLLRMAGIAGVVVAPEYRGRGVGDCADDGDGPTWARARLPGLGALPGDGVGLPPDRVGGRRSAAADLVTTPAAA